MAARTPDAPVRARRRAPRAAGAAGRTGRRRDDGGGALTNRERPDADDAPDAGAEPGPPGAGGSPNPGRAAGREERDGEAAGGSEGPRFDLIDVTEDPAAAEPQTIVVAFRCPKCQQMLHIEYLVNPFGAAAPGRAGAVGGGGAATDGVGCPRCGARHRLRLPGVVRDVRRAD